MADNRGVAYIGPGKVEVQNIDYPELRAAGRPGRESGQRRPRAAARGDPEDRLDEHLRLRPAHGPGPHDGARGADPRPRDHRRGDRDRARASSSSRRATSARCRSTSRAGAAATARSGNTGVCLNVNPDRPGSAYGYVDMGGWVGGQAEYVLVPYADWNLLKFPDKERAMEKILDLTMLSDIFPTGYHGAYTAGVTSGSTVYVAGAGPVGLAAAHSAQLLGAAVVIVGDLIPERLEQAESFGCETDRHLQGRPQGPDRADPRRAGGRRGRRRGRLRGARARRRRRPRGARRRS